MEKTPAPPDLTVAHPAVSVSTPAYRMFRPAFSPSSCYLLRDAAEEAYFARHGGAPEAELIAWATQFIARDETFVDVGAHIGSWTQHFALKCKQVHAFEPQRSTFERLRDGVRAAKLGNVTCHDEALGGSGELYLNIVSMDGGGSTLRHRRELGEVLARERVKLAQLDDFDLDNVGAIKIDAEGFEIDILHGATRTLEKHRPTLLLEAWDHEWYAHERAKLMAYVTSLDYRVVDIRGWPQMLLVEPRQKRSHSSGSETEEHQNSGETKPAAEDPTATLARSWERLKGIAGEMKDTFVEALRTTAPLSFDRPLLGLVMIVKDEATRINAVLASYRPYIDAWTILDTGSTDGTQDLVKRALEGIPGRLFEEPFVDFAASRNRAL